MDDYAEYVRHIMNGEPYKWFDCPISAAFACDADHTGNPVLGTSFWRTIKSQEKYGDSRGCGL